MRALLVLAVLAAAGCGSAGSPTPAAKEKMPPEVEFDPVTAAEKYKAAKKSPRP